MIPLFLLILLANLCVYNIKIFWIIAIIIFVLSWIVQFLGHCIWEKNRPALLTNLYQAILIAPFYIYLELLFLCGYNKDLQDRIRTESVQLV